MNIPAQVESLLVSGIFHAIHLTKDFALLVFAMSHSSIVTGANILVKMHGINFLPLE